MNKVIDISSRLPHIEGKCVCLNCKHEWHGVAPIGTLHLECSECGTLKGVFNAVCCPEKDVWQCGCGCLHFIITLTHAYCCHCGLAHEFGNDI